jgi:hypothetical protein
MSTDPEPTQEANGAPETPADARNDLVENDSPSSHAGGEEAPEGGIEVIPEPSTREISDPALPSSVPPEGGAAKETASAEESGAAANLAYEDMLAKLVVATNAVGPEPATPVLGTPSPLPESDADATPVRPAPSMPPFGPSLLPTPPARRITPVNPSLPLPGDEDPTIPERRTASPAQPMIVQAAHLAPSEPWASVHGGTRSRLLHLMLGGMLVLCGMLLAVLVLKLLMPTPAPQPAAAVAPAPLPPPPSYAPPIQVEPLPAGTPPAVMPASHAPSAPTAAREKPAATREASGPAPGQAQRSLRKAGAQSKPTGPDVPVVAAAPEHTPAPEPAIAAKAPPTVAPPQKEATPPAGKKANKSRAYIDPFE